MRRLYRICLLRDTGLPLAEIGRALDEPGWDLHHAMVTHLEMLDHQATVGATLRHRLTRMITALDDNNSPTTGEFLETLEDMTMLNDTVQQRISILVYADIPTIHAYLVRVFGLGEGRLDYDQDGTCMHGEVQAGDGMIWLHQVSPRFGLASPAPPDTRCRHGHHRGDGRGRRRPPPARRRTGRGNPLPTHRSALRLPRVQRPRPRRWPLVLMKPLD